MNQVVLIVDDELYNRFAITNILAAQKIASVAAASG